MTKPTVERMRSEAKRFIAALDAVKWEDWHAEKHPRPAHGHTAKVRRASLTLSQTMEDFRTGRLP